MPVAPNPNRILVCSIAPNPWLFERTYNQHIVIPACKSGDVFASVWIEDHIDVFVRSTGGLQAADMETVTRDIPCRAIADDITNNLEKEGVWICPSGTPTEQEIQAARKRRYEYMVHLVNEGDKLYARFGDRALDQIPDFYKRASHEINEPRDWVIGVTPKARIQCEGCGTQVELLKDGTPPAVCAHCKAILDRPKAERLGLVAPTPRAVEVHPRVAETPPADPIPQVKNTKCP